MTWTACVKEIGHLRGLDGNDYYTSYAGLAYQSFVRYSLRYSSTRP
jgi:hypothetical protein